MFLTALNILGPIVIITLIGYVMGRYLQGMHVETLGELVILVATPALVFSTLAPMDVAAGMLTTIAGAAVACVGVSIVFGLVLLRAFGMPARSFLPSLAFPNSGNMGLPLALLAFGQEGLKLGISFFVVIALAQHTVGYTLASGNFRIGFLLRQPLIYAVGAVLVVLATGAPVPAFLLSTAKILGGMMIPAMLIMLGYSLAKLNVSAVKPAIITGFGRLIAGILSAILVIELFSLSGVFAGTLFVMATMPSAIVTYVYAQRFRPDADHVAGAVVVSTLLTFACLPVLLWIALRLAEQ